MPPVPAGDAVDVWWFDTRAETVGPAGLASLDRGERDRADGFLFPADRHRYQVAHVTLRQVLAGYVGVAPRAVPLGREPCPRCGGPSGKPVLLPAPGHSPPARSGRPPAGPGLPAGRTPVSFSLAHSGDMVVIAVASRPVGVDVEREARGCVCSLAAAFHPDDRVRVGSLAEPARHQAVITCWALAEAVLKCTGEGVMHGTGGFPVLSGLDGPGLDEPGPDGSRPAWSGPEGTAYVHGCALRRLPAPPGYRAAVALVAGPVESAGRHPADPSPLSRPGTLGAGRGPRRGGGSWRAFSRLTHAGHQ